jgi:uncharacterized protein (TIGR02271 family)
MAKTVIGFFEQVSEAQQVLQDLLDHGFDRDHISLIAHQERSGLEAGGTWRPDVISVPGVGPVLATGPLAASLSSTTGGPSGAGLVDVLKDYGVPATEAEWYLDSVRRGGVLVAVETGDADADRAVDIMNRAMQPGLGARGRADRAVDAPRTGEDIETIERSIDLHVPVQTAYQQWARFEEFPRFMEGVEEVRRLDAKRLHWVANIGGTRKEWDAQITEDVPNERMAWRSEAGEFTAGMVTFQPLAADRTRMTVRFEYEPHGVKETLGDWLGLVSRRVENDLERFKTFVEAGARGAAEPRTTAPTAGHMGTRTTQTGATAEGDVRVPVVEEELQVGTRQVRRGGVRLYTRVVERPVEETVRLRDETVHVERRAVDRPATEADVAAAQEGTLEVTETDEEPVVRKQARVVEEVVVGKAQEERTETVRDTVRRTEVEVEPVGAGHAREARGFETFETDFRHHYTTTFASGGQGQAYERWAPGYRYGYELARDPRYAGRDWAALEPEARRDWEGRHQGTWEEFKDTIRYAWDQVRGQR